MNSEQPWIAYVIISNYYIVARYLNAFMDRVGISAAPGPNTEGIFEPTASALQGQRSVAIEADGICFVRNYR